MPKSIVSAMASAVRHAGWWLEWHTSLEPGSGCRELDESNLAPEVSQCASSS